MYDESLMTVNSWYRMVVEGIFVTQEIRIAYDRRRFLAVAGRLLNCLL